MDSHRLTQTLLPPASGAAEQPDTLQIGNPGMTSELSADALFRSDPFSPMNPGSPQEEGLPGPFGVESDSAPPAIEPAPLIHAPGTGIPPLFPPTQFHFGTPNRIVIPDPTQIRL